MDRVGDMAGKRYGRRVGDMDGGLGIWMEGEGYGWRVGDMDGGETYGWRVGDMDRVEDVDGGGGYGEKGKLVQKWGGTIPFTNYG